MSPLLVGRGAKCACASHGCVLAWTSALSFATAAAILSLRQPTFSPLFSSSLLLLATSLAYHAGGHTDAAHLLDTLTIRLLVLSFLPRLSQRPHVLAALVGVCLVHYHPRCIMPDGRTHTGAHALTHVVAAWGLCQLA